ncbi:MAG TPA: hypothetical protein VKU41_06755 [Polyangiaceae bacterium]|nr:hypothetical protein [Polyangiaceae bacterium]
MELSPTRIVTCLSLAALVSCADVWGFKDLSESDGAPTDAPAAEVSSADGSAAADATTSPPDAAPEAAPDATMGGDATVPPEAGANEAGPVEAAPSEAGGAAPDGAPEGGPDAGALDAGGDAADGCGPTDTPDNCGACGASCDKTFSIGASCKASACSYSGCAGGHGDCDDASPDLNGCETVLTTPTNCGACGRACDTTHSTGATCDGTSCSYRGCVAGWADCNTTPPDTDGCETAVVADAAACGVCGQTCDTAHSQGGSCNTSATTATCQYATCDTGWADCVTTPPDTDGCETQITTPANCGMCGQACNTTTGTPACSGGKCSYTCTLGRSDCNASSGADTDGCECLTPACCGSGCQMTHDNGVGGSFYDCTSIGTHNQAQALSACKAFTGNGAQCTMSATTCGLLGLAGSVDSVCGSGGGKCYCWAYGGTYMNGAYDGTVQSAAVSACSATCPANGNAVWN